MATTHVATLGDERSEAPQALENQADRVGYGLYLRVESPISKGRRKVFGQRS